MFLLVSGAAASGKSTVAKNLSSLLENLVCHDADERIVTNEYIRCQQLEEWVQLALNYQQESRDFLLTSHSPLGELLACPSARKLAGISACLLDCSDPIRIQRMRKRGFDPRWRPRRMFSTGLPGTECMPGIRNGSNTSLWEMGHPNIPMIVGSAGNKPIKGGK